MKAKTAIQVRSREGAKTLYERPLPKPRADGVSATLAGYRKHGVTHWY
jgi:hypothetical protein